ncbi:MAG: VirB3 family type IV secretion system protein [Plesiomonas shigelloides]
MPDSKELYATYNGLNRPAMLMGIPLMLFLALGFIGVFGTFIAIFTFGAKGFAFTATVLLCGFGLKLLCEFDPNALNVIKMNMSGLLINFRQQDKIIGFDSTGIKPCENSNKPL